MDSLKQSTHGLGQALGGFAVLVFLLAGISGTLYKLLAPGGWIAQAFGRSISAGFTVLVALGILFLIAWFTREYSSPRSRNRFSDLFVYGFSGAGALYVARFWLTGAF